MKPAEGNEAGRLGLHGTFRITCWGVISCGKVNRVILEAVVKPISPHRKGGTSFASEKSHDIDPNPLDLTLSKVKRA